MGSPKAHGLLWGLPGPYTPSTNIMGPAAPGGRAPGRARSEQAKREEKDTKRKKEDTKGGGGSKRITQFTGAESGE